MQLNKVGEKTYYLENATNIGIYQINEKEVYLIDTGNDKDCGKKILKIIEEQNWQIKGIINTHSHADHIGGNAVIQSRTNCDILSSKLENSIINNPILEPTILYGNTPIKELQNKFLMAKPSKSKEIKDLEEGLEYIELKGHSPNMIGVKTSDEIYFLGDALLNEETILKYHFFYLTDVKEFLNSLEILKTLKGTLFIPSHCQATENIDFLIQLNEAKVKEIINFVYQQCAKEITFESLLKKSFDTYSLKMDLNQYVLVGSTLKAYLKYLLEEGKITYFLKENQMFWKQI